MLIIARLRVLALPLMCLFGSLIGSSNFITEFISIIRFSLFGYRNIKKSYTFFFVLPICLIATTYPLIKYFPWDEYKNIVDKDSEMLNNNEHLLEWLKNNLNEKEVLLADIPTSSFLRSATNFRLVLHPQYEDSDLRKRVQDFYMLSACPPFSDVKEYFYKKYKTRYYISNIYRCSKSGNSINIFSVADKIDSDYSNCSNKNSMRFCLRVLYDTKNYKVLFRNGKYSVIYFMPNTIYDNTPYEIFDDKKYSDLKYYIPWINECIKTDKYCLYHIEEVARIYMDVLKYYNIAHALYSFVEKELTETNDVLALFHLAEYYDYDLKNPEKAKIYYEKSVNLIIGTEDSTDSVNNINHLIGSKKNEQKYLDTYYIRWTKPFVSLSKRMTIISAYAYFLTETKLNKTANEIYILFFYLNILVEAVLHALEHGYYYVRKDISEKIKHIDQTQDEKTEKEINKEQKQIIKSEEYGETETSIVKQFLDEFDAHSMVHILCNNASYLYQIKNQNPQFIILYKNFWSLIKKISFLNECVLNNFKKFENRDITLWDSFRFFYIER